MENNESKIKVIAIFDYINEGSKIVRLQFPDQVKPSIGMCLKDARHFKYTIAGIVFESKPVGTWDCLLKGDFNNLTVTSELDIIM